MGGKNDVAARQKGSKNVRMREKDIYSMSVCSTAKCLNKLFSRRIYLFEREQRQQQPFENG